MKRFTLLGFLFLLLPFAVSAANFQAMETVDVATNGNSYAAGKVIQVSSEVTGDVYLAGENVNINARVREDAFLAGRSVTVNAPIEDDLHVFGETIIINDDIRGDLIAFGSTVIISPESRILGDVIIGAENITANGQFDKSVRLMGSHINVEGVFLSDVDIRGGGDPTISPDADIRGNLHLLLPDGIAGTVPDGVVRGKIEREVIAANSTQRGRMPLLSGFHLASFFSRLLIGAILILCSTMFVTRFGENMIMRREYGKSLGMGLLAFLLPPIVAIILFVTFLGIPLAAILIMGWGALLYIASLLSGLLVANFFFPLLKTDSKSMLIGKFALGTLILFLLKIIPFAGIITFVIFLLSIGAICDYKIGAIKALRKSHCI